MRMKRAAATVISLVLCAGAVSVVRAQSLEELQAQIAALLQQIAVLQQRVQAPIVAPSYGAASGGQCPSLPRTLHSGLFGSDVADLQRFLARDVSIYPEATISGYFGALTERAVQRFQAREGVVSAGSPSTTGFGAVGPATRAAIMRRCAPSAATVGNSCWNGTTYVPHGSTIEMYSTKVPPAGYTCASFAQTRTCVDGVLTGSSAFQYASCGLASCTLGGTTYAHGESDRFYSKTTPSRGFTCKDYEQERTCLNGAFTGSSSYSHLWCSERETEEYSCIEDGVNIDDGESRMFYSKERVPFGESCASYALRRTCLGGGLSGSSTYSHATCTAAASNTCTLDGVTVQNGSSRAFFNTASVPYGSTCTDRKITRTCTKGILSGDDSFSHATCTPASPGSCTLDGLTVNHGSTGNFSNTTSVPHGSTCPLKARTCSNGTFLGDATYTVAYSRCVVGGPPAPTCTLSTNKAVYLPYEPVVLKWTATGATSGTLLQQSISPVASGSRSGISYSAPGEFPVTLTVQGSGGSGQCTATVKVQNVLPPTCTLSVRKAGGVYGSSATVNYGDEIDLKWTSTGAQSYATSSTHAAPSATTSVNLAGGTVRIVAPRDTHYTYTFYNDGGSTQCTATVNFNPPTCSVHTVPAGATYIYGDSAHISWTSTNADYATATSSDRIPTSGSTVFTNLSGSTAYSFTFVGLGGQKTCNKNITVSTPLSVTSPSSETYQKDNLVVVSWHYPGAAANARVRLILVRPDGSPVASYNIAAQQPASGTFGWVIPTSIGGTAITSGQYRIRAIAYLSSSGNTCTNDGCTGSANTDIARADSGLFSISVPMAALSRSQLASALAALESVLRAALDALSR